ncbi:hypothetical protein BH23CHL8_BH23CHL8_20090 [soil metagenome]
MEGWLQRIEPAWVGAALFLLALGVYVASNPVRADFYDHFVWQAHAFLQGRTAIEWPVTSGPHQNAHLQDVLPIPGTGTALLPFPPLPAIVLLPFVAVFGLGTNGALVAAVLGALNVTLCWVMLLSVTRSRSAALLATLFYGFGTVAWYAAMLGSTWFLAHVVASTFLFLAITVALRRDPDLSGSDRPQGLSAGVVAGLLLGLAGLARLTTIFGAPFFALVGVGGSFLSRVVVAGLGAGLPLGLLVAYNLLTTGHVLHPAYQHLYEVEYRPRPELVNPEWGIEDVRYIPQNAGIMLAWPPETPLLSDPACRGEPAPEGLGILLDRRCPLLRPDPLGMSLLLASPAYLLAIPGLLAFWRRRMVLGAALAVSAIALVDLAHFSQGWVQFGYRFSNDFAPFATILVALGIARLGVGLLSIGLVAASVLVNAWGVWWGVALGW